MILGIDTTLPYLSLALADEAHVLTKYQVNTPLQGDYLVPILRDFLTQNTCTPADLTQVVCTTGPGSFTGVRIGLACARAMGLALNIPVHGISTFHVLSYGLPTPITVLIDTLRDDFYAQNMGDKTSAPYIFNAENNVLTSPVTGVIKKEEQSLFPNYISPKYSPAEAACLIALKKPDFLSQPSPLYVRGADVTI